jgi:ABC-type amino acid transport substrate-binding protein
MDIGDMKIAGLSFQKKWRKKMKIKKLLTITSTLALSVALLASCGTTSSGDASSAAGDASAPEVRVINVAASPGYKPITYTDEKGTLDGYDVVVLQKIDELLPEYEFTFEAVDKETLNIGVETGKYQIGINGLFRSPEREEKYLIPENNLGATRIGFVIDENDDTIKSWGDLVTKRVAPTIASGGIFGQLNLYNSEHPDKPIPFETVSQTDRASDYASVRAGDYDAVIELIDVYNQIPDPALKAGVKITDTVSKVSTFPIINKSETELAEKINKLLGELRENGTLSEIAIQYYGADVFAD